MVTVAAHRIKQYGVEFYQASFPAREIDRLVKFEVLGYGGIPEPSKAKRSARTRVNWDVLESRIGESAEAYQRPLIRRKIEELVAYFTDCREAGKLPAIAGAVIITADKRLTFKPVGQHGNLGVGGLNGGGRGDNPGILLVGGGLTVDPIKNLSYRTNLYYMWYDQELCVANVSGAGVCAATSSLAPNKITSDEIGLAWDNEVSWWLDKNMVVKGQFSFIFPGDGVKQVTRALANNGSQPDDTAIRLAVEMLWNF